MGLFVSDDGHYQGWLAALLCCCAAVSEDESPIERERERERSRPTTRLGTVTCNTQSPHNQTAVQPRPYSPAAYVSNATPPAYKELESPTIRAPCPVVSDQPPSLKPLDLGSSNLIGRKPSHSRKKSGVHGQRPSISAPSSFRRLDFSEGQRHGLIPLRLEPVRLSPAPESPVQMRSRTGDAFSPEFRSDSTEALVDDNQLASYRASRETPYERIKRYSSSMPSLSPRGTSPEESNAGTRVPKSKSTSVSPETSRKSSAASLRRQSSDTLRGSSKGRQSYESSRLKRLQSNPSLRHNTNIGSGKEPDVDREVIELNTIVEERMRRGRSREASMEHAPAVAPHMQVRARAETLNSIGSAFSRPATSRQQPAKIMTTFDDYEPEAKRPAALARTSSRASNRVSGWLSGLMSSASPSSQAPANEPFYKCRPPAATTAPRARSRASSFSSFDEITSPSLTVASSPITSKGHSRSLTAESHVTPYSPVTIYADRRKEEEQWPPTSSSMGPVGIAY